MKRRIARRWMGVGIVAAVIGTVVAPTAVFGSHDFTDVPDGHTFHTDISWLVDNGITSGCETAPAKYCPGDSVKRGQLAAFMRRLAEKRVVDAGTVQGLPASAFLGATAKATDADKLDGKDSTAFVLTGEQPGIAQDVEGATGFALDGTLQTLLSSSITAPTDGFVLVMAKVQPILTHTNGTVSFADFGVSDSASSLPEDQDVALFLPDTAPTGDYDFAVSPLKAFPVTAGAHTFYLLAGEVSGDIAVFDMTLTLLFVPNAYGTVATSGMGLGDIVSEPMLGG